MNPFYQHNFRTEAKLTVVAEILLDLVYASPISYTTIELMSVAEKYGVASPATLHKGITLLKNEDYILAKRDKKDGRIVRLSPAKKAHKYIAELNK